MGLFSHINWEVRVKAHISASKVVRQSMSTFVAKQLKEVKTLPPPLAKIRSFRSPSFPEFERACGMRHGVASRVSNNEFADDFHGAENQAGEASREGTRSDGRQGQEGAVERAGSENSTRRGVHNAGEM